MNKGTFINYVDRILSFFDPHPCVSYSVFQFLYNYDLCLVSNNENGI